MPDLREPVGEMVSILEGLFGYFSMEGDLRTSHPATRNGNSLSNGHSSSEGGEAIPNGANFRRVTASTSSPEQYSDLDGDRGEAMVKSGPLGFLLHLDDKITTSIALYFSHPVTKLQKLVRLCCKLLEISGHGVPWFAFCFVLLLYHFFTSPSDLTYLHYGCNMLLVLIVDVITVAPVKLIFKRPRPRLNVGEIPLSMSQVDQYAFPSGHASRCVALAAYFCYMPPFNPWTHMWYIWGLLVSFSRITFGRHHVSDVIAGMFAGVFIFEVVRWSNLLQGVS